ncbi:polyamine ABC transporter substrate-binding protein [Marinomonas mediterranea]|jgi:Spermidine/putrescine-binding periplasmic protein|uniref:Putrescine-binding periplasmic protein n=1 Tax=Marinomonas mediterranea (strain ATCC 700492 / JCM 21426 / NBRC 103028 / MMB-1) TaxID=717774 RepID=F2JWZ2_MARM1|nr:polyamine ABC transporter substrate-binding protein [Marinomonas mediterranea]ADZ93009.1 extracellular solute-binding protein family 1 [Marinomonas mediterranea MMB-1]WCN10920.1 extracellular solute-binding protein [Marinomonas mediterranea]WCN14982.1 extracellular solute-binding protein [Marinomonas mediterranea]WCN19027.1 extracellular solute-binding protein [Marinomonas mediterranea MMB-1]
MNKHVKGLNRLLPVAGAVCALSMGAVTAHAEDLKFYNWSDYIAEDTIPNFEERTGINVIQDVFDSNEVLEAKLLAGSSGYDLVVPSDNFLARQIKASIFAKLDKSKLPNLKYIDKKLLSVLETADPGNEHGVPYMWGSTGIGYNVDKVKEVLGDDAPVDSWDLVFKAENMKKLQSCGVMFLDSPDELYPLALNYVGKNPNSHDRKDYSTDSEAAKVLKSVRPYVRQFHSSQYISALANGEICVAIGWSGDVIQAQDRASEAENGVNIEYSIPKEGTQIWFDMLAIPKGAKNKEAAYKFINYLLEPKVIADISNYVAYANPNTEASQYQDEEITNNAGIYPSEEVKSNMYAQELRPMKIERSLVRMWTDLKTAK